MKEVLQFIFNLISEFISTSMTWKIYDDLSLTHFIFGGLLLIAIFSLFGFVVPHFGDGISYGITSFRNAENKKEKASYYHMTQGKVTEKGNYTGHYYRVNRKTGEARKI